MKQRKGLLIFGGIASALVLAYGVYRFVGTQRADALLRNHLTENGYSAEDIQSLDVNHSFLNAILFGKEWTIHLRYADEPDSLYIYTVKNGQVQSAGVAGSTDKDDLKHVE